MDATIDQAEKEFHAGNHHCVLALLQPLLKAEKLSLQQELKLVSMLSHGYRLTDDFEAALPHAQRFLVLALKLFEVRSQGHAMALKELCLVHTGLEDFSAARKSIADSFAIMDKLSLQQHAQYGFMLVALGELDRAQERYEDALASYDKAKAVLVQCKEGRAIDGLLNRMAICHKELHQWNEAVACIKEDVEHVRNLLGPGHPEYATALNNLAVLFDDLKQYEEAIPRYEEALAVYKRACGAQHERTVYAAKVLASARQLAQQSRRDQIDVGHAFRMCNQCGAVKVMSKCDGCNRAWYCGTDCQLQHWPTHKPLCEVCLQCETVLSKVLHCSRCKKGKYCDAECFKVHWSKHKKDCQ